MSPARWLPIESNPDVMNRFLHRCGLSADYAIHDVLGTDAALLAMLPRPVLAVLLLFPINEKTKSVSDGCAAASAATPSDLYFTRQTVSNACGTVAMIHAIGNNLDTVRLADNSPLAEWYASTRDKTPTQRAALLESCDAICDVHDAVARTGQTDAPRLEDDVDHHFVCLVAKQGTLYELDGRHEQPLVVGQCDSQENETFIAAAMARCTTYMQADAANVKFNIMALAAAGAD